jgi:hypothetical protein
MTRPDAGHGSGIFVEPTDTTLAVWFHSYELAAANGSSVFRGDFGMGSQWLEKEGTMPTVETIESTHVYLGDVAVEDLDACMTLMQGEVWSPNGEARDFIQEKGLAHTSMSVGDVVMERAGNSFWMVDRMGWKRLPESPAPDRLATPSL